MFFKATGMGVPISRRFSSRKTAGRPAAGTATVSTAASAQGLSPKKPDSTERPAAETRRPEHFNRLAKWKERPPSC
jgi:hypothetical protein